MTTKDIAAQIKVLYLECLECPEEKRAEYIKRSSCPEYVKSEALRLIGVDDNIDDALSQAILSNTQVDLWEGSITSGDVIEQYCLNKKIGEGGQGEVWLAHRNDGEFDHKVAIKLIKLSPKAHEYRRFHNERELLASLKHPNITALIGGGRYHDRLYMIMEWVDGVPLFDYVKNKALSLEKVLESFQQVCEAVSYAHSKGVIHRDIKPSNVLVNSDGVVKLLDFGIAKTLNMESTLTQSEVMMTVAYSSPEQIDGQSASTATDVYALGLLLYELFTGQQAQQKTTDSAVEYLKVITELTPAKPSQAVTQQWHIEPRSLMGDLDNMVMMSIRKEPVRRYRNADVLLDDIRHYLLGQPLIAGGDGLWYKTHKLIKRNPLTSLLSVVVMLFILILPMLMYQYSQRLATERDKANENALVANKTTEFLTTLFESVSPLGSEGEQVDLPTVLSQGERQMTSGLTQQPRVLAALSMIMASIQHHMENTPKAIEHYDKAAQLYHQLGDQSSELMVLGQLAVMHFRNDDLQNSERYFDQSDQLARSVDDPKSLAWHATRKATVANERGQQSQAQSYAEKALSILYALDKNQQQDPDLLGRIYSELGEATKHTDKEKSLIYNEKSLIYAEQHVGKNHPFYLGRLSSRAIRLMRLNRHEQAQQLIDQTIQIAEALYSTDHPRYASFLTSKATYLHDKGFFKETEQLYLTMLSIYKKHLGENHYNYARVINNLAYLYEDHGYLQQARPLYEQSVQLRESLDAKNLMRIASAQSNLARLYAKLQMYDDSSTLVEQVIPVFLLNDRNNIYNKVIQLANIFKNGENVKDCQLGLKQLEDLTPKIQQESVKSWRRMGAELWISQMLNDCGLQKQSLYWHNSAKKMAKNIYHPDSEGLQLFN